MLAGADAEVDADVKGKWIRKTRRAYFVGEYDGKGALKSLVDMKVDASRAEQLIEGWRAERDGRYREVTVRQLSKWAAVGVITPDDMKNRLRRLGYNDLDSNRIIFSVQYDLDAASQRAYEKTSREIEKRFKDNKQAKKANEKDLEKRLKDLEKERERIQKEMDRRKGLLGDE
jgi:gas vesicle protein